MAFPNIYNHRKVADTAARACDICFKQSSSVLITPDSKDFFYVCPWHLTDRKFCTPLVDEAAEAAKKKAREEQRERELKEEVERVKKEYEERKRKKAERGKDKDGGEEAGKDAKAKKEEGEAKADEAKPDEVVKEEPRVFELGRLWYQARLQKRRQAEERKRQVEQSKLNQQRLQNPTLFPSVPSAAPGMVGGPAGPGTASGGGGPPGTGGDVGKPAKS